MVPNEFALVQSVVGPRLQIVGDEEETRTNSFWAVNDGCHEARRKDPAWGLLVKSGGAQVEQRAADVWLYALGDGTAQVVDIVGNAEGAAPPEGGARTPPVPAWGEKDLRSISEWAEPYPRSDGGTDSGGGGGDVDAAIAELQATDEHLQARIDDLQQQIVDQDARIVALEATVAQLQAALAAPRRAHGPVDLPIVVESLTRMRAKGDIDVAVEPGPATPPPPATGEPPSVLDAVLLKRLLDRLRPDGEPEP